MDPLSHPTNPSTAALPDSPAAVTGDPQALTRPLPPLGSDPAIRTSTTPAILEAQETILRDLPELLRQRRGQWVAYHGAHRIGFGATKSALWEECLRQGYQEFLIWCIYPYPETDYISGV